jgi:hypothetical protein
MALIADLLGMGRKSASRTIADVELALARLQNERSAAQRAISAAIHERDELLLIDDSDKAIAKIDADTDRHRLTVERCDKAEPLLLAELQQLRSAAKQARWRELRTKYDVAALDYAKALRVLLEKMGVMMNANDEARREGFEREVQATFVAPARLLTVESLNVFEAEIERSRELPRPAPKPVVSRSGYFNPVENYFDPARKLGPPVGVIPSAPPAVEQQSKPATKPKPQRRRIVEPAGPGQTQFRVQRSGYSKTDDGQQYAEGDVVALDPGMARAAVANGALDGALQ